jgi:hypothetical protein
MPQDQLQKGVTNTLSALKTTLHDRGVADAVVEHHENPTEPSVLTISVTARGKTATESFTHEEILDSGESVDAPVSAKVRMLVSHFI